MSRLLHLLQAEESPAVQELLVESQERASVSLSPRERLAETVVGIAFIAAVGALVAREGLDGISVPYAVGLTLAFAAISTVRFDVGSCYTAPSQLAFVPMLFLLPPAIVPVCVLVALMLAKLSDQIRARRPSSRILLSVGDSWFAVGPAAVFVLAGAPTADDVTAPIIVAAIAAQFAVDFAASAARLLITRGRVERAHAQESAWIYAVDLLLWPIGFMAAVAESGRPGVGLGILALATLLKVFAFERTARLAQMLELSRAYRGTAVLLGDVVEADHEYTGSHSRSVVDYSTGVADVLGLDSSARRRIEFGALLHDVGKVRVPKTIIDKPGPLNAEEWTIMRNHTIEGEAMLRKVGGALAEVGRIVRSSHEHFDGTGYPDGLKGEEIPIESRIITCCDAYSAMTTDRSYRSARSPTDAIHELRTCAGTHFDPQVVTALTSLLTPEATSEQATPRFQLTTVAAERNHADQDTEPAVTGQPWRQPLPVRTAR